MSNSPERDSAGQWSGGTQQGAPPSPPSQGSAPGQEHLGSAPSQGGAPGTEQISSSQTGTGQPQGAGIAGNQQRSRPGRHRAPVNEAETRVTWRRIFQYWIDAFLVSIVPYLVGIPFDNSNRTSLHIIGGIVMFVLFLVIGFWYWVVRPHSHNGQTFAMQWFGLRVISKDGGQANTIQYFIRWISLIFDAFPWVWPLTGLLGLIVMLCSRFRQRAGDHWARTLVISDGLNAAQASQYAGGHSGTLSDPASPDPYGRPGTGL